ncbi:M50 family metallopeptidase [Peribacillus sp. SCS-37]|uniref:M50 family metallopeptidase n=1 Tax=Paraperibacillus esterisolvens TaxID=3115296 RepID=UPI003905AAF0
MILAAYIISAAILCRLPLIGRHVNVLHTLVHETGHALTALMFDGKVKSMKLFSNSEGVILTGSRSSMGRIMTSLAGYPFSSGIGLLFFILLSNGHAQWVFYSLFLLAAAALLFWVRNMYGIIWCAGFLAFLGWVLSTGSTVWVTGVSMLLAGTVLVQSLYSAFHILCLSFKSPGEAGDASSLAQFTFIPAQVWGITFFGTAVAAFAVVCCTCI